MAEQRTTGSGPRVALLHGFTQTHASWEPLVDRLGSGRELVRLDLPGHGPDPDPPAGLAATAARVGDAVGAATYVGYSMGGRVALRLALDRPDLVDGLVLIGATAGIDDPDERAARRRADSELAAALERDGLEVFLDRWLAQPLFAGLTPAQVDRSDRLRNTVAGLAASLRHDGTGTMDPPWWSELAALADRIPVTVIVGERDAKFGALGQRLVTSLGARSELVVIPGAGHACHLEAPDRVAEVLAARLPRA